MKKHAYLIMAHNEFSILKELIKVLDDERNDIYIHIDAKVEKFPFNEFEKLVKKSTVVFINRRSNVAWGGDTQIKSEMNLLKEAYKKKYFYYHLISGVDFPIKTQNYIHDFFEKNAGNNYINFESDELSMKFAKERMEYRHYFQNIIGRSSGRIKELFYKIDAKSIYIQKILGRNRLRGCELVMKKGATWFSISNDLVKIILDSEQIIRKYFYYGVCTDEMFPMTIAYNSSLRNTLVNDELRYIIWDGRCHPKILDMSNYEDMMASHCLFARKFSSKHDLDIIYKLEKEIGCKE